MHIDILNDLLNLFNCIVFVIRIDLFFPNCFMFYSTYYYEINTLTLINLFLPYWNSYDLYHHQFNQLTCFTAMKSNYLLMNTTFWIVTHSIHLYLYTYFLSIKWITKNHFPFWDYSLSSSYTAPIRLQYIHFSFYSL